MTDKLNDLMTPKELAELLHVSVRTVHRWRAERRGPARVKAGHRVLYRRADVARWILANREEMVREVA